MKHFKIMSRIVLLFAIVMLMSFIPETNREFFGDWQCQGGNFGKNEGCLYGPEFVHGPTWHWGFRHWIWMLMGLALFMYNAVLIITTLDTNKDEK